LEKSYKSKERGGWERSEDFEGVKAKLRGAEKECKELRKMKDEKERLLGEAREKLKKIRKLDQQNSSNFLIESGNKMLDDLKRENRVLSEKSKDNKILGERISELEQENSKMFTELSQPKFTLKEHQVSIDQLNTKHDQRETQLLDALKSATAKISQLESGKFGQGKNSSHNGAKPKENAQKFEENSHESDTGGENENKNEKKDLAH
jgi:hypothetical protein